MGNISYRLGQTMSVGDLKDAIARNAELTDSFERMILHLVANEIDFKKEPVTMGPALSFDPDQEKFIGDKSDMANMYLKRNYREPFVVPEKV
jgi:hypothetical protein